MKSKKKKHKCGCITRDYKPLSMCGTHAQELITQIDQLRASNKERNNHA